MLFSHPEVAKLCNDDFECAWQSLRPVPKVSIDFGNGHRLDRTLAGNIATWLCTPDGRAVDVIAGLVGRDAFAARLRQGIELANTAETGGANAIAVHHRRQAVLAVRPGLGADLSKVRVEQPLKDALRGRPDVRKRLVERPLRDALAADTRYNAMQRDPQVRALMAGNPLAKPAALTKQLFRDVLHVDLDDPYLGLAPYVLGGEGGRAAPPKPAAIAPELRARLLGIANDYRSFGRVDDEGRWAPFLCRMPLPGKGRFSASKDRGTHGRKLYYLYAKDRDAYVAARPGMDAVGQVIVKEAWLPAETDEGDVMRLDPRSRRPLAKRGDRWFRPARFHGLFIMTRLPEDTPGTDDGWVYATVSADRTTVTGAGRMASCMRCHTKAKHGRLFGLDG